MKLKFDSNLDFQKAAVSAIVDLFEGESHPDDFGNNLSAKEYKEFTELGIRNILSIHPDSLLKNLQKVQERNLIPKSQTLIEKGATYRFPNFSVEMETGTGKTYVYLRTIFELNQKFGFKKFIIVVPSIAIREGVLSSIRLMKDHFKGLYNNVPFDSFIYSSKTLNKVRQFATGNEIQIMIINIQAFQKDVGEIDDYSKLTPEQLKKLNVIHKEGDRMSRRPIEFIQSTNPIVIFDEPQSIDSTPKSKKAIQTLNPLFGLRYSATHKKSEAYNVVYRLDPVKAYDLKLVKQIEVSSIRVEQDFNKDFLKLVSIGYPKDSKTPQAKLIVYDDTKTGPKEKTITLKHGTDVSQQTTRPGYDGYLVTNICAEEGLEHVEFANGKILELTKEESGSHEDLVRAQLKQTIEEHFKKEKRFKDNGIKILSLIFIDKVSNYRIYEDGEKKNGYLADLFEELYDEISSKPLYKHLIPFSAQDVHNGYFSADRKNNKIISLKDTKGTTKEDEETYKLIMQDKETLLSPDVPLRFIFSHSALKEGWDNPNVFQICSLREIGTETERRQTIGRGLRLPVNKDGERIFDTSINRLTVVAGESFEKYAKGLQEDIERDMGDDFKFGRISDIAFSNIYDNLKNAPVGQEISMKIKNELKAKGFIDKNDQITERFNPEKEGFKLELPQEFKHVESSIVFEMKRHIFKDRIKNSNERREFKYRKEIELNPDFEILWKKINKKTRYFVEFETEQLIQKAVEKIQRMEEVPPIRVFVEKTELELTKAGVSEGQVLETKAEYTAKSRPLPDILSFLQRETELTRTTLVEIVKRSGRLADFRVNPQIFMTEVAKLIERSMNELVIDGIKYEPIDGQVYEMRLFEEKEIERYLNTLYEVQSIDNRTPYNYVEYESKIEKEMAEKLDNDENVKFFCKLPSWFVIPTPLGDYNPDWAIVTEYGNKMYLVHETKSTLDEFKRRDNENKKIHCGKEHFKTLGVDFKVVTNVADALSGSKYNIE